MGLSLWSKWTRGLCVLAMVVGACVLGSSAASASGNANFVGSWVVNVGENFTILTQDAGGGCTGVGVYTMVSCQVTGSEYTFTLVTGSYSSTNTGTISGNNLSGSFTDTNGTTEAYTATRQSTGPTITDLSVRVGPVDGGTKVVVTGSGFGQAGDADKVVFVPKDGGAPIPAVDPVVVSDTEIDLTTPNVRSAMPTSTFVFTNIQVTDINGNASPIADAGQFNFPITIVQLGDSIASGEGTLYGYTYNAGTGLWNGGDPNATWAGSYQRCHDSPLAYGQLVATQLQANFVQLACTGATFDNGITAAETDSGGIYRPTQFGQAEYNDAEPDVVLATFGADDVQFVDIVKACIKSDAAAEGNAIGSGTPQDLSALECTATNPGPTVQKDFFAELPILVKNYADLAAEIELKGSQASPKRIPKIVFTDYMNPFPPSGGCSDTWPLANAQMTYMNTLMNDLDDAITSAVTTLAASDKNVGFADIRHAIDGHNWCSSDPWDYGLSVLFQGGYVTSALNTSPKSQAPFHPTPQGQAAIAGIVAPVVNTLIAEQPTDALTTVTAPSDPNASPDGVTDADGDTTTVDGTGYDDDEDVDADMWSTPVSLGTFKADSHGNLHATVTIPANAPAGSHRIIFTGEKSGYATTLPLLIPAAASAPVIDSATPPVSVAPGTTYEASFGATGDPTPTFELAAGAPSWLNIATPFSGLVTGTPPTGTTSFTYSVVASSGSTTVTAGPFTVEVAAASTGGSGTGGTGTSGTGHSTGVTVTAPSPVPTATRVSGSDRIGTAIAASVAGFPAAGSAKAVVLASSNGFADALAGTPLAAAKDGPLLLTDSILDPATLAEITRVLPKGGAVYVLGGTSSVPASVATALTIAGFAVVRYGGTDRFDTARIIASQGLDDPTTLLLANGLNFPDGLSAGPAAASVKGAILLTDGSTLDAGTTAYLAAHATAKVYAVGGSAAAADLRATPLVGTDRYATAALVATTFFPTATVVGLSTGESFPDALAGGASVAEQGGPMLLTPTSTLAAAVSTYLAADPEVTSVLVFGGPSAVSAGDIGQL
jgi:hypothetical protein